MNRSRFTRVAGATLLLSTLAMGGMGSSSAADTPPPTTAAPVTLQDLGSLAAGGASAPIITPASQAQMQDHLQRLQYGAAHALPTGSVGSYTVPGNYNGKSRAVAIVVYLEPNTYAYRNYCGPGASRVLISNWTTTVPSIDTLAAQEQTDPNWGTYLSNMVGPINTDANTGGFYITGAASSQGTFNNWVAGDLYDYGRPAITALKTYGTYNLQTIWLNGWNYSRIQADHIIDIHGFNFSDPPSAGDNFYYVETAGTVAGTSASGKQTYGANKMWALVSENNGQIW